MTALIGRVPVKGAVQDPYPVKIIIGDKNIAANGHHIPGIKGAIFDGLAKGDWNLGCVTVDIVGGTFVFDDGRIQHLTASTGGDNIEAATQIGSDNIGYVSQPQGVPCIPGRRITDAHKQASFLALLNYGSGRYRSRATAETTSTTSGSSGTTTTALTGSATAFEQNNAVADSLDTVSQIYQDRIQNSLDAVVAEGGQTLSLHITKDLYVDYDPNARLIDYGGGRRNTYSTSRLD